MKIFIIKNLLLSTFLVVNSSYAADIQRKLNDERCEERNNSQRAINNLDLQNIVKLKELNKGYSEVLYNLSKAVKFFMDRDKNLSNQDRARLKGEVSLKIKEYEDRVISYREDSRASDGNKLYSLFLQNVEDNDKVLRDKGVFKFERNFTHFPGGDHFMTIFFPQK